MSRSTVTHWMKKTLLAGCLGISATALADEAGADRLQTMLSGYTSFSASFEQITLASNGRKAQSTEGRLQLSKPNRFRWHTEQPFPQEIVSDGENIWIYDPDLEQVTQRRAGSQQSSVPALILNGQIEQLSERYEINLISAGETDPIFDLQPLTENFNFSLIRLAFSDGVISELMLEDSLGQRTSVVFTEQQLNPALDPATFLFRVPDGVDLIVDIEN
ncbi:outer membrane lipoprotein chaperone LolA [Neptuniibacter halophilus]|uniref:outer membrane lipoprotein chaperone LolA n=1 Tax=Neptuniibacter halophilus TaxID=651666 RepID=UPI002572454F|nr:outer membrane lipoprotein chaperone LolA [Neptuniibacter halophilus]